MDLQDHQAFLELQDHPGRLAHKDPLELSDQRDNQDLPAGLDQSERRVTRAPLARQDLLDHLDNRDHKVPRVRQELQELRDRLVRQVQLDLPELVDQD